MTKLLINLSPETISKLDQLAKQKHSPRSLLIRKSIDAWIKNHPPLETEDVFGILKNQPLESLSFQRKLRDEW
ncbi:MAG: hypothetical protein JSS34_08385 [Proteobacteria bacterium]|nr:hypothetical protein [Pseudomonadota bacterium]